MCDAIKPEVPRNAGLERMARPAIDYTAKRVAKGQKTKKKIKAVTKKAVDDTTKKLTGPGGLPAGATGSPGGTGAGGKGIIG